MRKMVYSLAIAIIILISVVMTPATAVSSSNEKKSVIIGFNDKSDAALVKAHDGEIKYQYDNIHAIAASLPEQAINALENNPNVAYIEEDVEVHILEDDPDTPWLEDDYDETPWGVDRIDAEKVYSDYTGAGVKVAIIDTGIDCDHEDLIVTGGNSFVSYTDSYDDDFGHGTHVAGTIAAVSNGNGVVGVAPNAELYALKALASNGYGDISDINAAIDWSINNGMDVISMSLGSSAPSISQEILCQKAYDSGIVVVASAGNMYLKRNSVGYPAAYDSVIAVSATNNQDGIAYFSSIGPQVELAAPGQDIWSTTYDGTYGLKSGTSMAAPHVTGVVALLLSADNTLLPAEVRETLSTTAIDLGASGKDIYFGYGLVNARAALDALSGSSGGSDGLLYTVGEPITTTTSDGKYVSATVEVTVTDQNKNPVKASVSGKWTITIDGRKTYVYELIEETDSYGTAIFETPENLRFSKTYDFDDFEIIDAIPLA